MCFKNKKTMENNTVSNSEFRLENLFSTLPAVLSGQNLHFFSEQLSCDKRRLRLLKGKILLSFIISLCLLLH